MIAMYCYCMCEFVDCAETDEIKELRRFVEEEQEPSSYAST